MFYYLRAKNTEELKEELLNEAKKAERGEADALEKITDPDNSTSYELKWKAEGLHEYAYIKEECRRQVALIERAQENKPDLSLEDIYDQAIYSLLGTARNVGLNSSSVFHSIEEMVKTRFLASFANALRLCIEYNQEVEERDKV